MLRRAGLAMALVVALGACGNTSEERGITGAGLGAAGGAIIGAVTGLTVLEGALIGTGVGGLTGILTDKGDLDIGDPFWKGWFGPSQPQVASSAGQSGGHSPRVAEMQTNLARLGYDPGPIDGQFGPRTSAAIREYQQDHGLAPDGRLTRDVATHVAQQTNGLPD